METKCLRSVTTNSKKTKKKVPIGPSANDWRTSDEDEINRRRERAREEQFKILNPTPQQPVFASFQVRSPSGMNYTVEIRDVKGRRFACSCVDFLSNRLGTCKHVESVLLHLEARFKRN